MKKIKNILLTGILALMAFSSCNEESIIGELPMETGTVTISFSTEGLSTKAPANVGNAVDGYKYTTADELNVNKCFVSIFKKNGESWEYLTSRYGALGEDGFTGTQSSGKFTLSGLTLPINTDLKVVAIVNPLDAKVASYKDMSYADLSEEMVNYGSLGGDGYYTFDPKSLIKVGEQDMRFEVSNGGITCVNGSTTVSLTQLAAKVQLDLKVDLPKLEGSETTSEWTLNGFTLTELTSVLTKKLMNSASQPGNAVSVYSSKGKLYATDTNAPADSEVIAIAMNGNGCSHVNCKIGGTMEGKCAHLTIQDPNGMTIQKIETTPTWLFNLKTLQVINVNTQSKLILTDTEKNNLLKLVNTQVQEINKACKTIDVVLYTYEMAKVEDLGKALTVELVGESALGNAIKTSTYRMKGNSLHPYWENGDGWGDGGSKFSLYDKDLELEEDPISSSEIPPTVGEGTDYKYSIHINPKYKVGECTDGLIHGNYYHVSGELKRSAGEFKIWVAPWVTWNISANFK